MGRKKLSRTRIDLRVEPETPETLRKLAYQLGYVYDDTGSIAQLLDAIATGKIILTRIDK